MAVPKDFSDVFLKVSFQEEKEGDPAVGLWRKLGAQPHQGTVMNMKLALEKLYPNHSMVLSQDFQLDILGTPGVLAEPLSTPDLVLNTLFIPLPRNRYEVPGALAHFVEFGGFKISWQSKDFILYTAMFTMGRYTFLQHYILHEGPTQPAYALLLDAFLYRDKLHNEIWVFNQGYWQKNADLWQEIQSADWEDVILEDDFKNQMKKDVYGFFDAKKLYEKYGLPWKRGIILHGPPGNGKTISIKAIMKDCDAQGFSPMYVKSFHNERGIQLVFAKARQNSPCIVVLEDLDSLITDSNRSYFLNELDGLSSNDGLLVIGTTNHFERLDPGISTRPSRFDRKYLFDDPNRNGRWLYVQYWQDKLADSEEIEFPDSLADEIADKTERFSFAYLKEVFVSGLVTTMTRRQDGEEISFAECVRDEIEKLRKQLDKPDGKVENTSAAMPPSSPLPSAPASSSRFAPFRGHPTPASSLPDCDEQVTFENILDRLANAPLGLRQRDVGPVIPLQGHSPSDFRALTDMLATRTDRSL